jgi:serine/threonine protein kinase
METERWQQVDRLLQSALERPPAEREAFLREACHGDPSLEREVRSLLAAHHEAVSFLESPAIEVAYPTLDSLAEAKHVIGPYHLLELIGEGGMGEVWLAEQKEPVRRRVAVKLIKAGMDTREVVSRFEAERQALALMDNPTIAKVFDAGSTPQGRPYFVMEYVAGISITAYCDKHKLTMRRRLELFIQVCEGVQHAHQKAIIHRDLKPSNILVTEIDGTPVPRIIDFGVAKATSQRLSAGTVYTRVGSIIGTPEYMSPEQADMTGEDVDTRTDVYSLGVILYELLVGVLPLDLNRLPFDEVMRCLREQDAPRPSTKLRTIGDRATVTAQNRCLDPRTLGRQLNGDLDSIALKALEKDRARRYATPTELAADIERYLRHEPVMAHPASVGYRARKYIRRHRLGVGIAASMVVLLVAFAIVEALQLRRITRERDRADRLTEFMTGMFKVSDPSEARGNTVTAREILDKASKEIDTGLAQDPELQAKMMYTMAYTYTGLGLYARSESLVKRALEIQRRVLGSRHPDTLHSMGLLATDLTNEGNFPAAEELQRETLAIQESTLGPEHRETLKSMTSLAESLDEEGRYAEAEKLYRETLESSRRVLGPEDLDTLYLAATLSEFLTREGHYAEAENLARETLEVERRILGPDHVDTLQSMRSVARALWGEGHYAESEKLFRELLDIQRRVFGPVHPNTLTSMSDLAQDLTEEGRYSEAENLDRAIVDLNRRVYEPEHRWVLIGMSNLAIVLGDERHYAEAETLYRQIVEIQRRTLGRGHPYTLLTLENEAINFSREGRYSEAERLAREAVVVAEKASQPGILDHAWYGFACTAAVAGRRDEALVYLRNAINSGFRNPEWIEKDRDLKSLHGDPRFEALVAEARQTSSTPNAH